MAKLESFAPNYVEITRRELRHQWQQFGEPECTAITLIDVAQLVIAQLNVTLAQRELPEEQRDYVDFMRENPLLEIGRDNPHLVDFDNPAIRQYAVAWLRYEYIMLKDSKCEEGQRKFIACGMAIKLLKQSDPGEMMT